MSCGRKLSYMDPYEIGYRVSAMEIEAGTASRVTAVDRDLFPDNAAARTAWDSGYEACVCAHRLGHDVGVMIGFGIFEPSTQSMPTVVAGLLDRRWSLKLRPDPRSR